MSNRQTALTGAVRAADAHEGRCVKGPSRARRGRDVAADGLVGRIGSDERGQEHGHEAENGGRERARRRHVVGGAGRTRDTHARGSQSGGSRLGRSPVRRTLGIQRRAGRREIAEAEGKTGEGIKVKGRRKGERAQTRPLSCPANLPARAPLDELLFAPPVRSTGPGPRARASEKCALGEPCCVAGARARSRMGLMVTTGAGLDVAL